MLSNLNESQRKAVLHTEGPCCVVAGAGSGKTRVLTYRTANLVANGVPARNILCVTFTKKAAGEMQERLGTLVGDAALEDLSVGTFHSICYRILREQWKETGHRFYEPASEYWVKKTMKNILAAPGKFNPYGMDWDLDVGQALGWIGWQKNNLITPNAERLARVPDDASQELRYRHMYRTYEKLKEEEGKLDFDDMLLWCYELLRDNLEARGRYRQLFKYILVDEFQDTNLAQYEILKFLAGPERNVFVVGDARQSIYGFRAAKVDFILKFSETWPGAKVVVLDTNYRSSSDIVDLSNSLIKRSSVGYPGECRANAGAKIAVMPMKADDEDEEAEAIITEIKALAQEGYKYGDNAILYRTNAQSRAIEDALITAEIPYIIYGAPGFYNRKEVKDIIAYMRIIHDPNDEDAIRRVVNVPSRYLGKAFVAAAAGYARKNDCPLLQAMIRCPEASQWRYRQINDFLYSINRIKGAVDSHSDLGQLVFDIRKVTGYDAWLAEEEGIEDGADNPRLENLNCLAAAAAKFGKKLKDFIFYAQQAAEKPKDPETDDTDKVQLMTLHRSKGLEFPVVFLVGFAEGLLPHKHSCAYRDGELVPESIEEERRLCYVGITRAEERLYLSLLKSYIGKPLDISPFFYDVIEFFPEFLKPEEDDDAVKEVV